MICWSKVFADSQPRLIGMEKFEGRLVGGGFRGREPPMRLVIAGDDRAVLARDGSRRRRGWRSAGSMNIS
jgi:hypothetical protein